MQLIARSWLSVTQVRTDLEWRLWKIAGNCPGQSTVEYALVGALVVIAAAGAMTLLGGEVTTVFSRITSTLSGAAPPAH